MNIRWPERRFTALVAFDAVLGAILAWAQFMGALLARSDDPASARNIWVAATFTPPPALIVPMLLAVLTLSPLLIRYLEQQLVKSRPAAYWTKSALVGVLMAILACAAIGVYMLFFAFLVKPFHESFGLHMLLAGPFLLAQAISLLLVKNPPYGVLLTGAAFGLINGYLVRRFLSRGEAL